MHALKPSPEAGIGGVVNHPDYEQQHGYALSKRTIQRRLRSRLIRLLLNRFEE